MCQIPQLGLKRYGAARHDGRCVIGHQFFDFTG